MGRAKHIVARTGASRGADGSGVAGTVTSGGRTLTSGATRRRWATPARLTALAFLGFGLVQLFVNVTSLIDERQALGRPIEPWQPWIWEATSLTSWLLLLPLILWLAERLRARLALSWQVVVHLLGTLPVSLVHSGAMVALRHAAYALVDARYQLAGAWSDVLLYEYRKDAVTYTAIVALFLLLSRIAAPSATVPAPAADASIEVRDGSRAFFLKPDEIAWVSAAGNYIELHGDGTTWLARRTLSDIAAELEPLGFVQIHRSRLVRRALIAKVETRQSGDFDVTLRSGHAVGGSRRYRANIG
jgi:LytTr DNA-binding domain